MKKRRDPSKKSMSKFYIGIIGSVLCCLVCVVVIGRIGGATAPTDNKYWLTENQDELVQYLPVEDTAEPEPEPAPNPSESDDTEKDEPESQPVYAGLLLYQIKWGDTLTKISNYSGFGIQELADFNLIEDPNLIYTRRFMVFPVGFDRDIVVNSLDAVREVLNGNLDVEQLSGEQVRDDVNNYVDISYFRDAVVALQMDALQAEQSSGQPEQAELPGSSNTDVVEKPVDDVENESVDDVTGQTDVDTQLPSVDESVEKSVSSVDELVDEPVSSVNESMDTFTPVQ